MLIFCQSTAGLLGFDFWHIHLNLLEKPLIMSASLQQRCHALLSELGLIETTQRITATPLTGGVASDIAHVRVDDKDYCVKFALAKLRVKADWYAPVSRNLAEYRWLETYARIDKQASLALYGHSASQNGFVMGYLSGDDTYLLKTSLLEGHGSAQDAIAVGKILGRVHQISTTDGFDTRPFENADDFRALRIEPYLLHTAKAHHTIAPQLHQMADQLYHANQVLVHGDVSPKNILVHNGHPYLLDAECATMGDASFDVSFCLNHFILKALHVPACRAAYLKLAVLFWQAYKAEISFEDHASLEQRIAKLVPMLMLARVDGKSPVEYLDQATIAQIRDCSVALVKKPLPSLYALIDYLA